MEVLLIGANGQIGKHIIQLTKERDDINLTAMVRKQEQADAFEKAGVSTVVADLEGSVDDLVRVMEGMDTIIFTAGSGGHTGADKTILVDLDGAIKSMEAAEEAKVDRYIMVSAIHTNRREKWLNSPIKHYSAAKYYADLFLSGTSLNYTIIRPGGLENEPGTGKVLAGELAERGNIPREDVARTVVESLNNEKAYYKGFDLISGEQNVSAALNQL